MVFKKNYANVYDSLYQNKDYEKECDFIEEILKKQGKTVKTILDLGCGTGGHVLILAKRGYKVTGIDQSEDMLKAARNKARSAGLKIDFHKSSIQDLRLNQRFDVVISMFAVMGYQTDNEDLALACKTAKKHLRQGGNFIFDAWNGLAVMADSPTQVVKDLRNGNERIVRITRPNMDMISHSVDVNFNVLVLKRDKLISETEETHKMRFFYPQEIKYFLQVAGFSDIKFCPFLKPALPLSERDWNMSVIAK
ncbi:MAG: class I SAM-dependent methyltransferase [Nitrospirae bacterium]|nr:class I SAM-dependent methyltransferase [Nitrospirota bacterium]